jgi:hypothetical protein
MVYAQLVLGDERGAGASERAKAMRALGDAARAGFPEAQGCWRANTGRRQRAARHAGVLGGLAQRRPAAAGRPAPASAG